MNIPSPPDEQPLLPWLIETLKPMTRTRVKEWLRDGHIQINGVVQKKHDTLVGKTDLIRMVRAVIEPKKSNFPQPVILFEDESLIAIDKPVGLLSVASDTEKSDTAFVRLDRYLAERDEGRPYVVHRLDRDTSGILLFSRTPEARDELQANWPNVVKTYLAFVEGTPRLESGTIQNFLVDGKSLRVRSVPEDEPHAKLAISHYKRVKQLGEISLMEVRIDTGRKHQIRVHMRGIGCPIIGDKAYGAQTDPAGRLGLHAWKLSFNHPDTGQRLDIECPLPEPLQDLISEDSGGS